MKQRLYYILAAFLLVFGYQNCGPEIPSEGDNSSQAGAPFAFSVGLDRIAYMSCTDTTDSQDFFTFKGATFDTTKGGIGMTSEFRLFTRLMSSGQRVEAINSSEINRSAQMQLGIRPYENLVDVFSANGQPIYKNILNPLNLYLAVQDFANLGPYEYLPDSQYPLRGNLQLGSGNGPQIRDLLHQKQGLLTLTFLKEGEQYASRSVDGKVPGAGYHLMFDCGGSPAGAHVLCATYEYDLFHGTNVGNWDCPASYRFKIIRNGDQGIAGCSFSSVNTNDPVYIEVRKILGPNWSIDLNNRCVMPSTGSCYGSQAIDYSLSSGCDQPGFAACARHLSVCLKDN